MLKKMSARDYHVSITVPATPIEAFNAINVVTGEPEPKKAPKKEK